MMQKVTAEITFEKMNPNRVKVLQGGVFAGWLEKHVRRARVARVQY